MTSIDAAIRPHAPRGRLLHEPLWDGECFPRRPRSEMPAIAAAKRFAACEHVETE